MTYFSKISKILNFQISRISYTQEIIFLSLPPTKAMKIPSYHLAAIAQLGERETEDLKVAGSSPACSNFLLFQRVTISHPFYFLWDSKNL